MMGFASAVSKVAKSSSRTRTSWMGFRALHGHFVCSAMSGKRFILDFAVIAIVALCAVTGRAEELYGAPPKDTKEYLDRVVRAYPDKIDRYDKEFLILKNGTKFRISDGRTDKTLTELLEK